MGENNYKLVILFILIIILTFATYWCDSKCNFYHKNGMEQLGNDNSTKYSKLNSIDELKEKEFFNYTYATYLKDQKKLLIYDSKFKGDINIVITNASLKGIIFYTKNKIIYLIPRNESYLVIR